MLENVNITVFPDFGSTWVGSTVYLNATIVNNGSNPVNKDFPLNFYRGDPDADNDGLIDPGAVLIGSTTVISGPAIPQGQQRSVNFTWTPTYADVGAFTIYAVADPDTAPPFDDGLIDEENATWAEITDNKAFYDTALYAPGPVPPFVTATPPDYEVHDPRPNLAVVGSEVTVDPDFGSTYAWSPVTLNATVRNVGKLYPAADDFNIAFTRGDPDADGDGIFDAGVALLATATVSASASPIPAGGSVAVSLPWTPGLGDLGAFTLYAAVDLQATGPFSDGAVDEPDTAAAEITDNKAFYDTGFYAPGAAPPFVTATPPDYEVHDPRPNLAVANGDLSVSPDFGSTYAGNTVLLNATVHNAGKLYPAANDFAVAFTRGDPDADGDGVIDPGTVLLATATVNASASPIPPGGDATVSVPWTPLAADLGAFTLYASVDLQASGPFSDGAVDEPDTTAMEITDNKALYDTGLYPAGPAPPFVTATPPDYEVVPIPPGALSPPRNVLVARNGPALVLTWDPPLVGVADAYEVFRGVTPRGIDLLAPYVTVPATQRVFWDLGAAVSPGEDYYVVRALNLTLPARSATSVTAGGFTVLLPGGFTPISLPLQPFQPLDALAFMVSLGAKSLAYMDGAGAWVSIPPNPSVTLSVGAGYLIDLPAPVAHTFVGWPGSAVLYDGIGGFGATEAASLNATVAGGDVLLTWAPPAAAVDHYCVRRSPIRTGFHLGAFTEIGCTPAGDPAATNFTDPSAAALPGESYYLVVPVDAAGANRSTSFSIGVWRAAYWGWHAIGLPLKPLAALAVSAYADDIPLALGILWWSPPGTWVPHFAAMNPGTYDAPLDQAMGVQLAVRGAVVYAFVGT